MEWDTDHAAGCHERPLRRDAKEENARPGAAETAAGHSSCVMTRADEVKIMTEYDSAEIYDHPIKHMTVKGIFRYIGVDMIPWKGGGIGING